MKKILSLVITVVMLLSCLSTVCFAATSISMKTNPSVFMGGSIYNIVWSTDQPGIGYVEYTYQGQTCRIYDEEDGVVRIDDYIHTVQVPVEELNAAGSYTVTTSLVSAYGGRAILLGNSCSKTITGFRGTPKTAGKVNVWAFSDIHRAYDYEKSYNNYKIMLGVDEVGTVLNQSGIACDLLALNGDLCYAGLRDKEEMETCIFDTATHITGGKIPVVYARGNHEPRGPYGSELLQYIAADTGEFYFQFTYGPMSAIVLDYGQDHYDSQYEFVGMMDYSNYYAKENAWMESLSAFPGNPTYRVLFTHGHDTRTHFKYNWVRRASELGCDLMVCGHVHSAALWVDPAKCTWCPDATDQAVYCEDFPVFVDGAHGIIGTADGDADYRHFNGGQVIMNNGTIECNVYSSDGEQLVHGTFPAGMNLKSTAPDTTPTEPSYGSPVNLADASDAGYQTTSGFGIITKPTVFDTGDFYTVCWATTAGDMATGEVHLTYEGRDYRFTQSSGGCLETFSSVHAVPVPKEYLDNNSYECISQKMVTYNNWHYAYHRKGYPVSSGMIPFTGYHNQSEIKMLQVSGLNGSDDAFTRVQNAASGYDMLVLSGNVLQSIDSEQTLTWLLKKTAKLANGGKLPVVFVRGENETVGAYAPYLSKMIRNTTGAFYEKVSYGPVSMLVIDAADAYPDDAAQNQNLFSFGAMRKAQMNWLSNQTYGDATYKLVVACNNNVYNRHGYKYGNVLNALGTDLALYGDAASGYAALGAHRQNYAGIGNGAYGVDGTVATLYSFKNGTITAKTLGTSGTVKATNTVQATANDNTYTDVTGYQSYSQAIHYASAQRLMIGTSADTFDPDGNVTRAQAVTVLARLADADLTDASASFDDVAQGKYYTAAVAWAKANGITNGTGATTFSPDEYVTREQFCTMLYRLLGNNYEQADACSFTDFDSVSAYAKTAVATLAKAGIINGMGDNTFAPRLPISRAMLAQILYNGNF